MSTIREKTEQVIIPVKAELIWFLILILAILGGIVGMVTTYNVGYRNGITAEKIGFLEDADIARREVENAP